MRCTTGADMPDHAAAAPLSAQELAARVERLEAENAELRQLVNQDQLTSLGNRRLFWLELERALRCAGRYGGEVSLVLADLDGLKLLNDTSGHAAGDLALERVGALLRATLRACDTPARLGGDEFAVILPATGSGGALLVAERVRASVATLCFAGQQRVTFSLGVATFQPPRGAAFDVVRGARALLAHADAALYRAKHGGKNRVVLTPVLRGELPVIATD